ncbi:hypothetical protein X975_08065, partial [Stegodyphus mimosarum]
MDWGGFMTNGCTQPHIFQGGSVTARKYVNEVLESQVRLFRGTVGPHVLLMKLGLIESMWCEIVANRRYDWNGWPRHAPDLNPIEHVWMPYGAESVHAKFLSGPSRS